MGAEMRAISVALPEGQDLNIEGARTALRNAITYESNATILEIAAEWVDLSPPDKLTRAVLQADDDAWARWKDTIYDGYIPLLEKFESTFGSREVAMHRHGGIKFYVTGGMSHGETPTNAYGIWVELLDSRDSEYGNPFYDEIYRGYGFLDTGGGAPPLGVGAQ